MTVSVPPKGKHDRRAALLAPHQRDHEQSVARAMDRGQMPDDLSGLLRWYAKGWDEEVPTALHQGVQQGVWHTHGRAADEPGQPESRGSFVEGGSRLGSPPLTDAFRRYLENAPSEVDEDGNYLRPIHAALSRMERRWPETRDALFALAACSFDWRLLADNLHWSQELFRHAIHHCLEALWEEYRPTIVRLA